MTAVTLTGSGGPRVELRITIKLAATVALMLVAATLVVALLVAATAPGVARRLLAFPFTGVPARPGVAIAIFAHNLRELGAIMGLLFVAQAPYVGGELLGRWHRWVRCGAELVLAAGVAANVIVVGVAVGAYRLRMVRAILPHGPFELAAYALAIALYLQGRHQPLRARHAFTVTGVSIAILALAAALEAFVNV